MCFLLCILLRKLVWGGQEIGLRIHEKCCEEDWSGKPGASLRFPGVHFMMSFVKKIGLERPGASLAPRWAWMTSLETGLQLSEQKDSLHNRSMIILVVLFPPAWVPI